jgi:hypothetical protein
VTISTGRCPPAPPLGYTAPIDTATVSVSTTAPWVRIFWKGCDPFTFTQGGHRFDPLPPPWIDTQVLYAGTSVETAIAEVLLRWHGQIVPGDPVMLSESRQLQDRRVARFICHRPLQLIDATGLGLARIEAAVTEVLKLPEHAAWAARAKPIAEDIFNCDETEYALTQQWCGWLRSQCKKADGLLWTSRQFNVGGCVALFSDRCEKDFKLVGRPGKLYGKGSANRKLVDTMVGRLGWSIGK